MSSPAALHLLAAEAVVRAHRHVWQRAAGVANGLIPLVVVAGRQCRHEHAAAQRHGRQVHKVQLKPGAQAHSQGEMRCGRCYAHRTCTRTVHGRTMGRSCMHMLGTKLRQQRHMQRWQRGVTRQGKVRHGHVPHLGRCVEVRHGDFAELVALPPLRREPMCNNLAACQLCVCHQRDRYILPLACCLCRRQAARQLHCCTVEEGRGPGLMYTCMHVQPQYSSPCKQSVCPSSFAAPCPAWSHSLRTWSVPLHATSGVCICRLARPARQTSHSCHLCAWHSWPRGGGPDYTCSSDECIACCAHDGLEIHASSAVHAPCMEVACASSSGAGTRQAVRVQH